MAVGIVSVFIIALVGLAAVYVGKIQPEFTVHKSGAIVITGASTGIGFDAAAELARMGYDVFATVRSEKDFDALTVCDACW